MGTLEVCWEGQGPLPGLFLASLRRGGLWVWDCSKEPFWLETLPNLSIKGDYRRGLQKGVNLISSDVKPVLGTGRTDLMPWMTNVPVGDIYLSAGALGRDLNFC